MTAVVFHHPESLSTEELLDPRPEIGQRFDRFEFELLDSQLRRIGVIFPSTESAPTISASTDRTQMRDLSNLEFTKSDYEHVDPFRDRLRPVCVLQNETRWPLGVYLFGEQNRQVSTRDVTFQLKMTDQAFMLDQNLAQTFSIGKGASIDSAFVALAHASGVAQVQVAGHPAYAAAPKAYAAGTSIYDALKDMATLMGCLAPYFDNNGVFWARVAPDPDGTGSPQFTFGPGRIVADSIVETDDSYNAPNRYIVTGDGTDNPVSGFFDVPTSAPHSIPHRGFVVADTQSVTGITTVTQAANAARVNYTQDTRSWEKVAFETLLDPRMDLFALIEFNGSTGRGLYLETGFNQTLRFDGQHTHEANRLWDRFG